MSSQKTKKIRSVTAKKMKSMDIPELTEYINEGKKSQLSENEFRGMSVRILSEILLCLRRIEVTIEGALPE